MVFSNLRQVATNKIRISNFETNPKFKFLNVQNADSRITTSARGLGNSNFGNLNLFRI
jgi:hypothetical protein